VTSDGVALAFERVVKDYRGLRPLRIASLEVRERERIALGGVDAIGAEALVNLVTGAALPDEGSVSVFGTSTASIASADSWLPWLDRFGIVSERAVMLEGATFLQNLALPLSLDIDAIAPEVKRRAEALAEAAGLPIERLGSRVAEGTPEEKVRAQVARALAFEPAILLLEHPSAGLPRERVNRFASDLAALVDARRMTALAISEDAEFANPFATRWLTVQPASGEVVAARTKWKLFG
jgi:ABC-type lipoprotein export system ATPase subunit